MLHLLEWEASIFAAVFGTAIWGAFKWVVRSFREMKEEIAKARRDTRIARHDDFQLLGFPMIAMLEEKHPELAEELAAAIRRKQQSRSEREAGLEETFPHPREGIR
jgi:hypothetical protein